MANKLKYEDVKRDIEEKGWNLLSTHYVNLKTDLEIACPENHSNFVSFAKFRTGNYECPICKQNSYYKTDNVATLKKGYRILAFDQASITSGWSLYENGQLLKYGKWTSTGNNSVDKIAQTKCWIVSMIKKFKPDEIVIEDIQLQKFGNGDEAVLVFKKLAHLQGVLENYFYEAGYIYTIVPPATWRANSQIKGKTRTEKKRSAQLKVKELYDISVTQDEADAILIGRWGVSNHKKDEMIIF